MPGRPRLSRILVISFSNLERDPRVARQLDALRDRHEVVAAGLAPPVRTDVEFVDISTPPLGRLDAVFGVARLLLRRFDAAFWRHPKNVTLLERLRPLSKCVDAVVVNDLTALPIALELGVPVVFDAHEYAPAEFADVLRWRVLIAPYLRWLCRGYIPRVAGMTAVGETIADAYERDVGVRARVVLNTPPYTDLVPTPVHSPLRLLHHGAALRGRGLEGLIDMVGSLDERFVFDLVLVESSPGYRDELVRRASADSRVRFLPPVPMRELPQFANDYDIGVYSLPPANFNQRFALPNKLFEFIQGRLAVAIGPSPEMAAVVERYGCGIVAADFEPASLASALNGLSAEAIAGFKHASHRAAAELSAERSAEVILDVVAQALDCR